MDIKTWLKTNEKELDYINENVGLAIDDNSRELRKIYWNNGRHVAVNYCGGGIEIYHIYVNGVRLIELYHKYHSAKQFFYLKVNRNGKEIEEYYDTVTDKCMFEINFDNCFFFYEL